MTDSEPTRLPTTAELTIATPEGVVFRLPLAGPAARLYAVLLDTAIVLAAVNGLGSLGYFIFAKAPGFGIMVITLAIICHEAHSHRCSRAVARARPGAARTADQRKAGLAVDHGQCDDCRKYR